MRRRSRPQVARSACGPLPKFAVRFGVPASVRAKARPGRPQHLSSAVGAWQHRLPCASRSRGPSHNSLRSLRSLRSHRCDESVVVAREYARGHESCDARRLPCALRPARTRLCGAARCLRRGQRALAARRAVPARGDFGGGEERSFGVGARTRAHRELTRRNCLSAESEANAASFAARPRSEHRSAVGAARHRPPRHEPLAGAACRAAKNSRTQSSPPRMATTGRKRADAPTRLSYPARPGA